MRTNQTDLNSILNNVYRKFRDEHSNGHGARVWFAKVPVKTA